MNDAAAGLVRFISGIGLFFQSLREIRVGFLGMDAAGDRTAQNHGGP